MNLKKLENGDTVDNIRKPVSDNKFKSFSENTWAPRSNFNQKTNNWFAELRRSTNNLTLMSNFYITSEELKNTEKNI